MHFQVLFKKVSSSSAKTANVIKKVKKIHIKSGNVIYNYIKIAIHFTKITQTTLNFVKVN